MKSYDKISGGLGIVIGVFFCLESYRIGLGKVSTPGPGFLPFLVGGVTVLLCGTILVAALLHDKRKDNMKKSINIQKLGKVVLAVLSLLFYNAILNHLGLAVTTFLFIILFMRFIETQRWTASFITAVFASVASWLVFEVGLKLSIPKGPWGF